MSKDNNRDKTTFGLLAWILPWAIIRHITEKFSFYTVNFSFKKGNGGVPAKIHTISSKQGRLLVQWRGARTILSLITPLLPFGLIYLFARFFGGTTVTRVNDDGERFADYRLVRLDRDYYLAFATERCVTVQSTCMALSEALDLAANGQRKLYAA